MNKKLLFIWILTFILCFSFVSAAINWNDEVITFIPLTNSSGNEDISGNNNDLTVYNGLSYDATENAYLFDGVNDYGDFLSTFNIETLTEWSTCVWSKTTDVSIGRNIYGIRDAFNHNIDTVPDFTANFKDDSGSWATAVSNSATANDWYLNCFTFNNGDAYIYSNSTKSSIFSSVDSTVFDTTYDFTVGRGNLINFNDVFKGYMTNIIIFNKTLSDTEVSNLVFDNRDYNPYAPSLDINDSTESTAVVKQVGSISFSGGSPTTIFSSDFNISVDNTPLYGGYTFQVASNGNNEMFCELLINGSSYANVTRTQFSGETAGNVYIKFPTTVISNNGTYNQELQCSRTSGTGLITISNAVGVGHFLIDQDGEFLNYNSSTISKTVTSGSSFTLLDSLNITIGDKTNTSAVNPRKNHIVIDGAFTYTNNGGSSETPSIYANVNGTNCSILPRTTSSGGVASVSYDCNIFNVTENDIYQIDFYGNGTNILYEGDLTAKNFFLSNNEIIGGTGVLKGASFSGNTYTTLISGVEGGNNNHDLANVFNKLSFAITTDTDTTVSIYFNITNGGEYLTNVWQRDFLAGQTGVMIGQDVIESLPKDSYNVSLHANCGTVGATCTISGGQTGGYLTDVITTTINAFDVTAYNNWTNESINDFNVTDGATVTSVNGTATYFSTDPFENLTISANNYFDTILINHNTSQDLNVSMKQSDIKFRATEIISGDYISPSNFTINGITKSVNESFYLSEGTYNVTFSKNGWFNKTDEITITALDNKTIIVSSVSATAINITANHFLNNDPIINFSGWVYEAISGTNITFSTTSGSYQVSSAIDKNFTVHIESDGYATLEETVFVNSSPVFDYNALMFKYNSFFVTFKDEVTGSTINNASLDVISSVFSQNYSTTNGTIYVTALSPEDYTLRYYADNYTTRFYLLDVIDDSYFNLTLYMKQEGTGVDTTIIVYDSSSSSNLEGAVVKVQRYDITTNSYNVVQMGTTDSDGEVIFDIVQDEEFYKFVIEYDGAVVKITEPQPVQKTTLKIPVSIGDSFLDDYALFKDIVHSLDYNSDTNNFRLLFNDPSGIPRVYCVDLYKLEYDQKELVNSSCLTSSSGTILVPVTPINGTTFTAYSKVFIGSESIILSQESITFRDITFGNNGLFVQLLLSLIFVSAGFIAVEAIPIAVPFSLIVGGLFHLHSISLYFTVPLLVVGIILSFWVSKNG